MSYMHLQYQVASFEEQLESILQFLTVDQNLWWLDGFLTFYPHIAWDEIRNMDEEAKTIALAEALRPLYDHLRAEMYENQVKYQLYWNQHEAFHDLYCCDVNHRFQNIIANIGLNPISPRYLKTLCFDVFYKNSAHGAMGMALHEIIHFVWFDRWNQLFHDDPCEYEAPHLKWIFSEMVTDTFMRDERLMKLNPYMQEGTAYAYFYQMNLDGRNVLDVLYDLYQTVTLEEFMRQGYAFCCTHENEIRQQMK